MSSSAQRSVDDDLVADLREFFRRYYREEIGRLAEAYPGRTHLTIDWDDLYRANADAAEDYLDAPEEIDRYLRLALEEYDVPLPVTLENVDVRVVGLDSKDVYTPLALSKANPSGYVGIKGDLAKVTVPKDELDEAAFECQRCGSHTYVPQSGGFQEPHECNGCERQGPFTIDEDESTFAKFCKIRIQTPPDESGQIQSQHTDGYVRGDLVWEGHDDYGLIARSGDSVTVYGTLIRQQETRGKQKTRLFEQYLDVDAIEFDTDDDSVDIDAHGETFEELAGRADAPDLFAESIAPRLYATPAWECALELLVAYLFGSPRISIPGGPTFRGDIHVLIVSDYAMGKSLVNEAVVLFSPQCIKESVTGMSSEVGLLAAAVEDDFGEGQWTLAPGILVRANGGHVVLDEIDKTDANLERMNDALEGEQVVDVNKAGQSATYNSKVGLLATGNPKQGRFNPYVAISEQVGIDQSLLSRFDGIVTMSDQPDEEIDANVAETSGLAYVEAQEYLHGDREELDRLDREVPTDVGRAWVAYARDHVNPILSEELFEKIKTWYAEEARTLNQEYGDEESDVGKNMPVPVTARVVDATVRFSVAFARVHLRDEVAEADVDRAIALSKQLVGQTFRDGLFGRHEFQSGSQEDRVTTVQTIIRNRQGDFDDGVPIETVLETAERHGIDAEKAEHEIEKMRQDGRVYSPKNGHVRWS